MKDFLKDQTNQYQTNRPIFNEKQFCELYKFRQVRVSTRQKFKSFVRKSCKLNRYSILRFFNFIIPCLKWLPKYTLKENLLKDTAAGLTVGIMQIPQGMAYAMLTLLPPVFGLYASFVPVIVYFIFGTSKHVSVGTFAIVCLMVGEVVDSRFDQVTLETGLPSNSSLGSNDTVSTSTIDLSGEKKIHVAIALSLAVGLIQILMGIARLGFVTVYLSDPMVSGFTTGAAFHIFSSQVRHFLGMVLPKSETRGFFSLFKIYRYLFTNIEQASIGALVIGVVCTLLLFSIKYANEQLKAKGKLKFPIPGELIVVVLGTGISYGVNLQRKYGVPILDTVPKGIPAPSLPKMSVIGLVVVESFTIAVVAFAINVSLAKSFGKKNNYTVDANQELVAYGMCNVVGSFFSCFPSAVSLSRSLIQESLGSTQITGVISAVLVLLVLVSMAPLFEPLPKAVLAAIVLVALKGLFKQFKVLYLLWKISRTDAFIWFGSFLGVLLLGVDYGLAVGIAITLLSTVARMSRPSSGVLGQIQGTDIYKMKSKYNVKEVSGMKIFQYNSVLHYANVEHFRECLFASTVDPRLMSESLNKENDSDNPFSDLETSDTDNEQCNNPNDFRIETLSNTRRRSKSTSTVKNGIAVIDTSHNGPVQEHIENGESSTERVHAILIDCSQLAYLDSMGVSTLANVVSEYKKVRIEVFLSCCSDDVLDMLDAGGYIDVHGIADIFVTIHDAVLSWQKRKPFICSDPPSTSCPRTLNESPTKKNCELQADNNSLVNQVDVMEDEVYNEDVLA